MYVCIIVVTVKTTLQFNRIVKLYFLELSHISEMRKK